MSKHITYKPFNAQEISLKDSNLIEASAGTGKTYSIALLVLRLLLEQKAELPEILMVTFTKAAVAELEERVRLFVRKAYSVAQGKPCDDKSINFLVQQRIAQTDEATVKQILYTAVLWLDETSILTIHSFCQNTLTEFAFETQQVFQSELQTDMSEQLEKAFNVFWRQHITTLPADFLAFAHKYISRSTMMKFIKMHMDGKRYAYYNEQSTYTWQPEILNEYDEAHKAWEHAQQELEFHVSSNWPQYFEIASMHPNAKKLFTKEMHPLDVIEQIKNKIKENRQYIKDIFPEVITALTHIESLKAAMKASLHEVQVLLNCMAIQQVQALVKQRQEQFNIISFNDLIHLVHKAIKGSRAEQLVKNLRKKYRAAFIDEFQDTDEAQYEIFNIAFGEGMPLFYIGDPKQSIYAFRKADIYTYFKARHQVKHVYTMNTNYRSNEPLIKAMNQFFLPVEGFDTFYNNQSVDGIEYIPVQSPQPNSKGQLMYDGVAAPAMILHEQANNTEIIVSLVNHIQSLLQDEKYTLVKGQQSRRVLPSDIGILVRSKSKGKEIGDALANVGIPYVTINEIKVLQTADARYVYYLLEAMHEPNMRHLHRALLGSYTRFSVDELMQLDLEKVLPLFETYHHLWQKESALSAIKKLVQDFNLEQKLLVETEGERMLGNLNHIAELVHHAQLQHDYSIAEVLAWLKKRVDGIEQDGDEYLQRLESDEAVLKIVTIHASKGLEYNIVFCPQLDFIPRKESLLDGVCTFKNEKDDEYISKEPEWRTDEEKEWYVKQEEQEHRRLMYVAITRAVYQCHVFHSTHGKFKNSTIATFINAMDGRVKDLFIHYLPPSFFKEKNTTKKLHVKKIVPAVNFKIPHEYWRRMSYSGLAIKQEYIPREYTSTFDDSYEQFIFNTLKSGAQTGDLVHALLENIAFDEDQHWATTIERTLKQFAPQMLPIYSAPLLQLLEHVMQVNIPIGNSSFQLSSMKRFKSITEMSFDFPVEKFNLKQLNSLSSDDIQLAAAIPEEMDWAKAEGIMTGKIDLFFEHEGRYYILDWKTNYLGYQLSDYHPLALAQAMNDFNYHLQYLIYTLAVKKYLQARMPHFNYEKHFGGVCYLFIRGIRKNSDTGIYFNRPDEKIITTLEKLLS